MCYGLWLTLKDLLFQLFYVIIIFVYFVSVCMYGCTATLSWPGHS